MTTTPSHISQTLARLKEAAERGRQNAAELPVVDEARRAVMALDAEANFASFNGRLHPASATAFHRVREWAYAIERREEHDLRAEGLGIVLYSTAAAAKAAPDRHPKASGYGAGKTHLLTAAAHYLRGLFYSELNNLGHRVETPRFHCTVIESIRFFQDLRDLYGKGGDVGALFNAATRGPLFIDDVGKEHVSASGTEWANAQYYDLVNRSYTRGRPLFITSNLSLEALFERLGGAATSRLLEMCGPNQRGLIDLSAAPDYRLTQGK